MIQHAATSILSAEWNNMTDLVAEHLNTPLGYVCPNQTQISMMSSSCMEAASNGVPSPLVNMRMHIQLRRSTLLFGIQSQAAKAVTVDVVDMVGKGRCCKDVYAIDLEKSTDYHNNQYASEITRFLDITYAIYSK